MWIHENKDWPNFFWDGRELITLLSAVSHKQGRLLGRLEAVGFDLRQEANLNTRTSDVVTSSAIEGEVLDPEEVRSSFARQLGLDLGGLIPTSRDVDGIVEMMLEATLNHSRPLTKERLFDWHAALFPTGRSGIRRIVTEGWRTPEVGPMQVVSGPIGREKVHFEAPAASLLKTEMDSFLKWINSPHDLDPLLRAAIAHFWFVTIHPFEDGNGRIARTIADMALAQADGMSDRFYSMSRQIEKERKDYYLKLESQQRSDLDLTEWMTWFLECLQRSIEHADTFLSDTLYKEQLWKIANALPINERQRLVLTRLLDDFKGHLNTSKYAKIAKCSTDTALRDIRALSTGSILIQNQGGGRSTSYRLNPLNGESSDPSANTGGGT